MPSSSDQFPFAMTVDDLMAALRPVPLKGEKIVPLNNHADELDRLRAHSAALASLGTVDPFGQGLAPQAAGLSAGPDFLRDYVHNRFRPVASTPPGVPVNIDAVGRWPVTAPATRPPEAIGSVTSPGHLPSSPWETNPWILGNPYDFTSNPYRLGTPESDAYLETMRPFVEDAFGILTGLVPLGRAWNRGREFKFGPNFRVAPFGNRTGDPTGELPHYHRRTPLPNGASPENQGISRHRPWDSYTEENFWERF